MAAGILAQPGTEFGPCVDSCEHRDCAATRAMAAALCPHCGEPIGYDVRFYATGAWVLGTVHSDLVLNETYAHARCEHDGAALEVRRDVDRMLRRYPER